MQKQNGKQKSAEKQNLNEKQNPKQTLKRRLIRNGGTIAAALILMPLFVVSGCSSRQAVFVSGITQETELPFEESRQEQSSDLSLADAGEPQKDQEEAASVSTGAQKESFLSGEEKQEETQASPDGYVYVCGAVVQPGVYPIQEGMRIYEGIALAGGFTEAADQQWLNLALPLTDGQRLYVYTKEETALLKQEQGSNLPEGVSEENTVLLPASETAQDGQKVNLNTADQTALMTLPGIGEAKAQAILQYRAEHGAFASIEEIKNISGIKDAVFEKIKDRITV